MFLINPPIAKPCEAPAGLARLAGALRSHNIECKLIDSNLEGILYLLKKEIKYPENDTWSIRAKKHLPGHLKMLRNKNGYKNMSQYIRCIKDINRILGGIDKSGNLRISLANYQDRRFSPLKSSDLLEAANFPETNPFFSYFQTRITKILNNNSFSFIGFSINYLSQALCAFAMIGYVKRLQPDIQIIVGGGLITSWSRHLNGKNPFAGLINHMVSGKGESFLLSLFNKYPKTNFYQPDYDDFKRDDYLSPGFILPYSASKGCYWNKCAFCPEKAEKNSYCPVPIQQVLCEIDDLLRKYKPVLIHFLDNALSPGLLKAIINHPINIPWYGFTRVTHHLSDLEFCRKLKQSGCLMLKLGIESGDPEVLRAMNKGVDIKLYSKVLTALNDAGIMTYAYLLFGTPFENIDSARRTLDFIKDNLKAINFLNLAIFNLPSNSQYAESLKTHSFYEGDLSLYQGFEHPDAWNRGSVRRFLEKKFKRNNAISKIIQNTPPSFTSNHAPFFSPSCSTIPPVQLQQ